MCVCQCVCVVAVCHRKRLLTIRRSCSKPPSKLCAAFVSNTRPSRHPLLSFTVPPSVRQTIAVVVGSYQLPVASCKSVAKTDACHCTKLATGLESHQQLLKESQMLLTCCCCCCCCCRCCCEWCCCRRGCCCGNCCCCCCCALISSCRARSLRLCRTSHRKFDWLANFT